MGEVVAFSRARDVARLPLSAARIEAPQRVIANGAQLIANIDGTILFGRYDESLEQTLVSLKHIDLFVDFGDFIERDGRKVLPGKVRLSLSGKPTKFVRDVGMAALYGPDILVGRDLISPAGLPAPQ
jgi:hypothetical protein